MNDKTLIKHLEEQLQSLAAYENTELAHTIEDAIIGIIELRVEREMLKHALVDMWFAYENKDGAVPHDFEEEAVAMAQKILGPWNEATKWLRREWKGSDDASEH